MSRLRRNLILERLETRMLLAGDVSADVLNGDTLILRGDDAANAITILQRGDDVMVLGREASTGSPTTVNGQANKHFGNIEKIIVVSGQGDDDILLKDLNLTKSVSIDTEGGNNKVVIRNCSIAGPVQVTSDSGRDQIIVDKSSFSDLVNLFSGAGNDVVKVINKSRFQRRLAIDSMQGADVVTVDNSSFQSELQITSAILSQPDGRDVVTVGESVLKGNVAIRTGRGNDVVNLTRNTANFSSSFSVDTGDGDDTIKCTDGNYHALSISSGSQNDLVTLFGTQFDGGLVVSTGAGNDDVTADSIDVTKDAWFKLEDGNDSITVINSRFYSNLNLNGGNDSDDHDLRGNIVDGLMSVIRFED